MSKYLRDQMLKNITMDHVAFKKLNEIFVDVMSKANVVTEKEFAPGSLAKTKRLDCAYTIRFDGRGFRLSEFDEVMKYFADAENVERMIFTMHSDESKNSVAGKRIEIRFDSGNANNCFLVVEDDDKDWVDGTFTRIQERLSKESNMNWLIQNPATALVIQLAGVTFMFVLSSLAAVKVSPFLNFKKSLWLVFLVTFLVVSNVWTYEYNWILQWLNKRWPLISFKKNYTWLGYWQNLVVGVSLLLFGWAVKYFLEILKSVLK